jgi:hypothetical protein
MGLLRPIEVGVKRAWIDTCWTASQYAASWLDPPAAAFYGRLLDEAYLPDYLINVIPTHDLIYISVPKAASTRIRMTLAAVTGRFSLTLKFSQWPKPRGPQGPRSMTVRSFYRLAMNPATLRFAFVRNPYARMVSCWADKYKDKPLVPGDPYVQLYLAKRKEIDSSLPAGADRTLSFGDFVTFAAAVACLRYDIHLQVQDDLLSIPGLTLDFVGKVENFSEDFVRVLDHVKARDRIRREALAPLNKSSHEHWSKYYTPDLADRIYRAHECDFDRFAYARKWSA